MERQSGKKTFFLRLCAFFCLKKKEAKQPRSSFSTASSSPSPLFPSSLPPHHSSPSSSLPQLDPSVGLLMGQYNAILRPTGPGPVPSPGPADQGRCFRARLLAAGGKWLTLGSHAGRSVIKRGRTSLMIFHANYFIG